MGVALWLLLLGLAPVEAQSRRLQFDETELLSLAALLPDPTRIHPDIAAQVRVDLSAIGPVAERLSQARAAVLDAQTRIVRSSSRRGTLDVERRIVDADLLSWRSEEGTAAALLAAADLDLSEFAVGTFIGFEGLEGLDLRVLRLEGTVDASERLSDEVGELLTRNRRAAAERHAVAVEAIDDLVERLAMIDREVVALEAAMVTAEAEAEAAQVLVDDYGPAFELALLSAPVEGTDFPVVVLDAYYRAQLVVAVERPSCEVRWDQLAGIGRVESRHGTYGGTSVDAAGRTVDEILGPVLDGDPWLAIADTDGGRFDGDTIWDRAVGPMQFIPSSWAIYGRDGDGDGEEDPHNLYDAALAAALHLCGTTGGLSSEDRFTRALLGYNRSISYGLTVKGHAEEYRERVTLVPGPDSMLV